MTGMRFSGQTLCSVSNMTTAILGVLTFVLLTAGLTLHGIYLESNLDLPLRPSSARRDPMSEPVKSPPPRQAVEDSGCQKGG